MAIEDLLIEVCGLKPCLEQAQTVSWQWRVDYTDTQQGAGRHPIGAGQAPDSPRSEPRQSNVCLAGWCRWREAGRDDCERPALNAETPLAVSEAAAGAGLDFQFACRSSLHNARRAPV